MKTYINNKISKYLKGQVIDSKVSNTKYLTNNVVSCCNTINAWSHNHIVA